MNTTARINTLISLLKEKVVPTKVDDTSEANF